MDCLENEGVCSVKKENNLGYYRLHTIWNNQGFRINIASREGAWTGEMKPENVQSISSELKIDPEKYLAECKEALTTDDGKKDYFYAVENGSFTWKKMIDEESGMKIRMGSIMVKPASFVDTVQTIIEVALNCKKNLNKELNLMKHEKEENLQRIHQLHRKLEELCDKKNIMETDLYGKFLLLLNSKKSKIQELEFLSVSNKNSTEKLRHYKNQKKGILKALNVAEAFEMDTEDEEEKQENESFLENAAYDLREHKDKCTDDQSKKSQSVCQEGDIDSGEETPDLDVDTCESSTTLGTSTANLTSDSSGAVKNVKKSFPTTKADILDFFFGSSS